MGTKERRIFSDDCIPSVFIRQIDVVACSQLNNQSDL